MRILLLGALVCSALVMIPSPGVAQTHDVHPMLAAPAPRHDHGAASGQEARRLTGRSTRESRRPR